MFQKDFLDDVAQAIGNSNFWQTIRLGTDGTKPTSEDGAIKGTEVSASGLSVQVSGNEVRLTALQLPIESANVREIGIYGAANQLQDRLVTPDLEAASGVRVDVTYILQVVGEGTI